MVHNRQRSISRVLKLQNGTQQASNITTNKRHKYIKVLNASRVLKLQNSTPKTYNSQAGFKRYKIENNRHITAK